MGMFTAEKEEYKVLYQRFRYYAACVRSIKITARDIPAVLLAYLESILPADN